MMIKGILMSTIFLFSDPSLCKFNDSLKSVPISINQNRNYPKKGTKLVDYYKIDDILELQIRNDWTEKSYLLTAEQLKEFKLLLKQTVVPFPSLLTKPGHLFMKVKFKGSTVFSNDYIYLDASTINFDTGTNKFGKEFAGTFELKNNGFSKFLK